MRIWLVTIGEPLPIDGQKDERLHRTGLLASMLNKQGHHLTWWSSTFDHTKKKHRFRQEKSIEINPNYRIKLLHGLAYKRNVSVNRIINHKQIARSFNKNIKDEEPPDIILSSLPSLELCEEVVEYANKNSIPSVIDIRDLWPDIFLDVIPKQFHLLGKLAITPYVSSVKKICKQANGIIGVSKGYLDWGLAYAGREQSKYDKIFPLGYPSISLPNNVIEKEKEKLNKIGINGRKTICCFIGTFGTSYDLIPVIKVAERMQKENYNNIQFVFCGDGEKGKEWKEQANGINNIFFTGWVSLPTIVALMDMADIGLAAYKDNAPQGLPNKIFEYLSSGLTIVSSLRGETEEFISNYQCGFTYDVNNYNSLYVILRMLIENTSKLNTIKKDNLLLFKGRFSTEKIYSDLINHLQFIIEDNKEITKKY